jgi:hypothetical protein
MLVVDPVKNMQDMLQFLQRMHAQVKAQQPDKQLAIDNKP